MIESKAALKERLLALRRRSSWTRRTRWTIAGFMVVLTAVGLVPWKLVAQHPPRESSNPTENPGLELEALGEAPSRLRETLSRLVAQRANALDAYVGVKTLYNQLRQLPPTERRQAMTVATRDAELTSLMASLHGTELRLTVALSKWSLDHPVVKALGKRQDEITGLIEDRMEKVFDELEAERDAAKAELATIKKEVDRFHQIENEIEQLRTIVIEELRRMLRELQQQQKASPGRSVEN